MQRNNKQKSHWSVEGYKIADEILKTLNKH